jgi:hypothetical protein
MSKYEILRADPAKDRERILGVWQRNLHAHAPEEHAVRYDWFLRNPIEPPRFWLATKGDEVVGTAGLTPRWVNVEGTRRVATIAGDFAVDAGHRMLQPALSLQKAVLASVGDGVDMVYALPNHNAIKVFERQGYQKVGLLTRYVKVLRTGKFLKSATGWRAAMRSLSPVIDLGLRLRSPETWHRVGKGRTLQVVPGFDARFDDLWQRASGGAAAAKVLGVRTGDFLRWRYTDCPLQKYVTMTLGEGAGGRLLGYMTWYSGDDLQVRVADLFVDPAAPGAAEDLLTGLIRWARGSGAASISCESLGAKSLHDMLERFGFVSRECKAQLMVSAKAEVAPAPLVTDARNWYFLRGDENVNTL